MKRKWQTVGIILIFVGTCIIPASAMNLTGKKLSFSYMNETMTLVGCSRGEIELKYYMEEGLSTVIILNGGTGPYILKTAIRLTQDEMASYTDWTMTKVNVAFNNEDGTTPINVRIYIYDKGTTPTRPGPVIVNDTTYVLTSIGITTIPLVTPVNLSGHEELWVAVEWTIPDCFTSFAWLDTITGPHVWQKGDFYYLNNAWGEMYTGGSEYDGNWGLGGIIEYGSSELSIGNIKGPIGVKANISNTGEYVASNVQWSILVTGGLLKRVKESAMGNMTTLDPATSIQINLSPFQGFGKINIVIKAKAVNTNEVVETKSAFLLGPFVIGIR